MVDLHPGQYLDAGDRITTLQGVDEVVHVEFAVAQWIAAGLSEKDTVEVTAGTDVPPVPGVIIALDARVDPTTRNAWVRARIDDAANLPRPGASVRVKVPVGPPVRAIAIPVNALRKGPGGDHVYVVAPDKAGKPRAVSRNVKSGPVLGNEVVVLEGLSAGEEVAASGSFKLHDGVLVAVVSEGAKASAVNGAQ
jgi:membrane fusion protein (multidrug efflux system)